MEHTIKKAREQIDKIDDEIVTLLAKRMEVARHIGMIKRENHINIIDTKRKDELFAKNKAKAETLGLSEKFIEQIYRVIHEYSVTIQKHI